MTPRFSSLCADRPAVAAMLREIGGLIGLDPKNRFRADAYERGARVLEAMPEDLETLLRSDRLTAVPGIGKGLAAVIREICERGRSTLLDELRATHPPGAVELGRVLSLPRMRALHTALGIDGLAALRAACQEGRVRTVAGFGASSERRLLERIDALAARRDALLLPDALAEAERLATSLRRIPGVHAVEIAGALRRRVETIERLELVVVTDDPAAVLDHAAALPETVRADREGDDVVVARRPTSVDAVVRVATPARAGAALIVATGSDAHVLKLAGRGTVWADGAEGDVYRGLGLAWVPPELREDAGEVEAAADGTLPAGLLRLEDLQGIVHCHTDYSDGKHTIAEMARGADALGMRYLTITDHSQTASYAGGLDPDRLERQADEIARVQETVAVRLLHGTESDILKDGGLDFPDAVLRRLDVVVASVHNRYRMDADDMTRRLVRAMRHPVFKIWGHALGRYVLTRPPFACHLDEVLDAIAASRAAIEVNGDPHRLDLEPRWLRAAHRRGIRFVVSADAHSVPALRNVRWGVDMARRAWLRPGDVLNTASVDDFRAAVRP